MIIDSSLPPSVDGGHYFGDLSLLLLVYSGVLTSVQFSKILLFTITDNLHYNYCVFTQILSF